MVSCVEGGTAFRNYEIELISPKWNVPKINLGLCLWVNVGRFYGYDQCERRLSRGCSTSVIKHFKWRNTSQRSTKVNYCCAPSSFLTTVMFLSLLPHHPSGYSKPMSSHICAHTIPSSWRKWCWSADQQWTSGLGDALGFLLGNYPDERMRKKEDNMRREDIL